MAIDVALFWKLMVKSLNQRPLQMDALAKAVNNPPTGRQTNRPIATLTRH